MALPYVDRLTLEIVPDRNAEAVRLVSGQVDVLQDQIRADDYREVKQAADAGRVRLTDAGPSHDRYMLWFNLGSREASHRFLLQDDFRLAVSLAVHRQGFADAVYLGAADPSPFPVPPANKDWQPTGVAAPAYDPARASALLDGLGLLDRTHDGVREDAAGHPVRFSVLVQAGLTEAQKGMEFVRDQLAHVGVGLDLVPMDFGSVMRRWQEGDYDAIYHHLVPTDTDPASNLDWWLSRGSMHMWHPAQKAAATPWEAEIDALMARQAATLDTGGAPASVHRGADDLPCAQPGDLLRRAARAGGDLHARGARHAGCHAAAGALGGGRTEADALESAEPDARATSQASRGHAAAGPRRVLGRLSRHAPRARRRRADDDGVRREPGDD